MVLTGGDGDGSDGIQVVKDRGGTVISQDATTAQVSGMPESAIATGDVDYVVQLADIASVLQTLARQGAAAEDVAAL